MKLDDNSRQTASDLLRRLLQALSLKTGGIVEFLRFGEFGSLLPLFVSCFRSAPPLTDREQTNAIRTAVINYKKSKRADIDLAYFSQILGIETKKVLRAPKSKYYLTSTISIRSFPPERQIRIDLDGVAVVVGSSVPKKFNLGEFELNGFGRVSPAEPFGYSFVYGSTEAKSAEQAALRVLTGIETLIGAINLCANVGRKSWSSGRIKPKASVLLGPYQIVHRADGTRLEDEIWYQPHYHKVAFPKPLSGIHPQLSQTVQKLLRFAHRRPYWAILSNCIRRYHQAISIIDRHAMLVSLWSILETITGTTRSSAEVTARRAAFLSRDPLLRALKFARISEARNRYVHAGTEDHSIEVLVDEIRDYVEQILWFLCWTKLRFKSHDDFIQMLQLPKAKAGLKHQIRVAKLGLRYLSQS